MEFALKRLRALYRHVYDLQFEHESQNGAYYYKQQNVNILFTWLKISHPKYMYSSDYKFRFMVEGFAI